MIYLQFLNLLKSVQLFSGNKQMEFRTSEFKASSSQTEKGQTWSKTDCIVEDKMKGQPLHTSILLLESFKHWWEQLAIHLEKVFKINCSVEFYFKVAIAFYRCPFYSNAGLKVIKYNIGIC